MIIKLIILCVKYTVKYNNGEFMLWNNFCSLNYVSCDVVYGERKGSHILTGCVARFCFMHMNKNDKNIWTWFHLKVKFYLKIIPLTYSCFENELKLCLE